MAPGPTFVVGQRPEGLIDCYLTRGEGVLQMMSVWRSEEGQERAISESGDHPAFDSSQRAV